VRKFAHSHSNGHGYQQGLIVFALAIDVPKRMKSVHVNRRISPMVVWLRRDPSVRWFAQRQRVFPKLSSWP
jgi:hypothetical protein